MTNNIFFISDTHFSHDKILTFNKECGALIRPFSSVKEMDEEMVKRWNEVARSCDKVYHLGDVAINRKKDLEILKRLNGDKILVRGNHDIFKLKDYAEYFRDIRGCHVMEKIIFSHIPIHPGSKARYKANVHGHLHAHRVMIDHVQTAKKSTINLIKRKFFSYSKKIIDPFYYCVSVENIDYRPIEFTEIKKILNETENK